jgi:hypothetical protein
MRRFVSTGVLTLIGQTTGLAPGRPQLSAVLPARKVTVRIIIPSWVDCRESMRRWIVMNHKKDRVRGRRQRAGSVGGIPGNQGSDATRRTFVVKKVSGALERARPQRGVVGNAANARRLRSGVS